MLRLINYFRIEVEFVNLKITIKEQLRRFFVEPTDSALRKSDMTPDEVLVFHYSLEQVQRYRLPPGTTLVNSDRGYQLSGRKYNEPTLNF